MEELTMIMKELLEEVKKMNEAILTLDTNNNDNFNSVIEKVDKVKYSIDHIGPIEVYG